MHAAAPAGGILELIGAATGVTGRMRGVCRRQIDDAPLVVIPPGALFTIEAEVATLAAIQIGPPVCRAELCASLNSSAMEPLVSSPVISMKKSVPRAAAPNGIEQLPHHPMVVLHQVLVARLVESVHATADGRRPREV
jgi:hypothetical protein